MQTVLEQGSIDNPLTFDVGLIQLSFIPVCSLNTCNISVKLCRGFAALQCFSLYTVVYMVIIYCGLYGHYILWFIWSLYTVVYMVIIYCGLYGRYILWFIWSLYTVVYMVIIYCGLYGHYILWFIWSLYTVVYMVIIYCGLYGHYILWFIWSLYTVVYMVIIYCGLYGHYILWFIWSAGFIQDGFSRGIWTGGQLRAWQWDRSTCNTYSSLGTHYVIHVKRGVVRLHDKGRGAASALSLQ